MIGVYVEDLFQTALHGFYVCLDSFFKVFITASSIPPKAAEKSLARVSLNFIWWPPEN